MAHPDHAAVHSPPEPASNEKATAGTNHIERTETNDNDMSLDKVAAAAAIDEFGARSKTNPAEIALVKKLDRTILVSPLLPLTSAANLRSPCCGSCTCKPTSRMC